MVDKRKTQAMAKKQQRDRKENSWSIEDKRYYNIDIYNIDPNQKNGLNYLVKD